jgi:hypothetical protein
MGSVGNPQARDRPSPVTSASDYRAPGHPVASRLRSAGPLAARAPQTARQQLSQPEPADTVSDELSADGSRAVRQRRGHVRAPGFLWWPLSTVCGGRCQRVERGSSFCVMFSVQATCRRPNAVFSHGGWRGLSFSVFSVAFGGRVLCPANVTFGHEGWRSGASQWASGDARSGVKFDSSMNLASS